MPVVHRFPTPERHPRDTWSADTELGCALHQGLSTPLQALRVSVEGLVGELRGLCPPPAAIPGVLDEVELVRRNVSNLVDYSQPIEPQPMNCSVEELVLAVVRPLSAPQLQRLTIAHAAPKASAMVDGPLVVRLLGKLVENALEVRGEMVLLTAHRSAIDLQFGVLNHADSPPDPSWALEPFRSTKSNRLGLGLAIADRMARTLGGALDMEVSPEGTVRVGVRLPLDPLPAPGEEVAA